MRTSRPAGSEAEKYLLPQAAINYRNGWFFVTSQVAHNKSIFSAIVGERCELNALGREVATWCNEYVLRHADEIWLGDLSPNGMLASMLRSLRRI